MFAEVGLLFTGPPPPMCSVGKAQGRMVTTCMTAGTPGMSWRILCQEPTPPATWAPCPWCWYQGVKHLVSRKSPPSFLLVLNHPRAHMTTDESRSTQVAQMLSLPASTLGDNAGGLGGVRRKQCTRGLWGRPEPPETTARWQGAPRPTSCLGPVLFQGRPGPWGCCERQLGGDG